MKTTSKNKDVTISVRFDQQLSKRLKHHLRKTKTKVSDWVRDQALMYCDQKECKNEND